MTTKTPDREAILQTAIDLIVGDRQDSYGEPSGQMEHTWKLWELYRKHSKGKYGGAHEAAMFLAINKLSRISYGNECKDDHYVDFSAYLAIAFEAELESRSFTVRDTDTSEPPPLDEVGV